MAERQLAIEAHATGKAVASLTDLAQVTANKPGGYRLEDLEHLADTLQGWGFRLAMLNGDADLMREWSGRPWASGISMAEDGTVRLNDYTTAVIEEAEAVGPTLPQGFALVISASSDVILEHAASGQWVWIQMRGAGPQTNGDRPPRFLSRRG